jgi:hypothetical protein
VAPPAAASANAPLLPGGVNMRRATILERW